MDQLPLFSMLLETLGAHNTAGSSGGDIGKAGPPGTMTGNTFTSTHRHPIAGKIASTYEVAYDQVMEWFSSGSSFEDILLALETDRLTELTVEDLLARAAEVSWEQLWDEARPTGPTAV